MFKPIGINRIEAKFYEDQRGVMTFPLGLDMQEIQWFYTIKPANINVIRAWQGHKFEQKWFYPLQGKFLLQWVKMKSDGKVDPIGIREKLILDANNPFIVHLPGMYYNGFQALEPEALLMVFSDRSTEESKLDDLRLSTDDLAWKE